MRGIKQTLVNASYLVNQWFWVPESNFNLYVGWWQGPSQTTNTNQSSDTLLVSENSAHFWHYLHGDSITFHRLKAQSYKTAPLPHFRCQSQVQVVACASDRPASNWRFQWFPPTQDAIQGQGCYLYFSPTGCKWEVLRASSSGLINILEWLTELSKNILLTIYHMEQPNGKDA